MRRAVSALLSVGALATGAVAAHQAATGPGAALVETVVPDEMSRDALRLHLETLLDETVSPDWLGAEIDAALAPEPPDWSRIDALTALAAERDVAVPPRTAARLAEAEAGRPASFASCAAGAFGAEIPDEPTAIICFFGTALTPIVGESKDLLVEGGKAVGGEPVDLLAVGLATAGLGAMALGPAAFPVRYAVATVKTAAAVGAVSARLAREAAPLLRRVARSKGGDAAAMRALSAPLIDLGRVALDAGPVAAVRGLRHADSLDDVARLRRLSAAAAGRPGPALEALGMRRIFATSTRWFRGGLRVWGWAAAMLAQLALLCASAAQWGTGRALRAR